MNRLNPNAFIVAIGCYAQLKPNELSDVKGVDLVLGANEKFNILDYIGDLSKNKHPNIYSCDLTTCSIAKNLSFQIINMFLYGYDFLD